MTAELYNELVITRNRLRNEARSVPDEFLAKMMFEYVTNMVSEKDDKEKIAYSLIIQALADILITRHEAEFATKDEYATKDEISIAG